jgi:hypothetical protein
LSESHNLASTNPEKLKQLLTEMAQKFNKADALYPEVDGRPVKVFSKLPSKS